MIQVSSDLVSEFLHILESCTHPGQLTSTFVNISLASQVACTFKIPEVDLQKNVHHTDDIRNMFAELPKAIPSSRDLDPPQPNMVTIKQIGFLIHGIL
ncbi:unnamed protein product [Acanthoscelides obtectus]|uniref:Uncharacterized protein n=1 Tax=Acanthoscelides obtectus TaxID=200917 RepID=A0A9P0JUD4_ACAOB|nr:unnamed protein product [Acanthoscelides obtectus]CAK1627934.1 hypothetical protein AOBTE_LOCUS4920 [Acanthoscelides obtectus]